MVLGNSLVEVFRGLLLGLVLIVQPMHLDFFYILGYDILIAANTLNPYQLVLLLHIFLEMLVNHLASLDSGIGAVKNSDLVLWNVDEFDEFVEADKGDLVT